MDQDKVKKVLDEFFNSLKAKEDHQLETGLSQHVTIDILHQATASAIEQNPERATAYVKWFLNASMFLLGDESELEKIE